MPVFLFLKQLVDMFYQFQILDYVMVLFALILLAYKIVKDKLYLDIWKRLCVADYIIVALGCVYAASFLRYPTAYGTFFKIASCFLLYFLGRVYADTLMQYGKVLAVAGYIVVYANFIYRFYQFGFKFIVTGPEVTLLNAGGLYYYKTDLAVGIIIAVLFIYIFSEKKILKWLTILPVAGYMVFYSGARMQQLVFAVIYLLILLREIECRFKKEIIMNSVFFKIMAGIMLLLTVVFLFGIQLFPFETLEENMNRSTDWTVSIMERLMHSRQVVWWDVLHYFSEQPFLTRLFGIDLETECLHNAAGVRAHSAYIKQIYATGYLGCILLLAFINYLLRNLGKEKNRTLVYLVVGLWVMLLGSGISIESLESTQMSWFPMLFAGIVISWGTRQQAGLENEAKTEIGGCI